MILSDYLVIGAGAASMAFIDTILTEHPETTITVVDKHKAPGGHWNDDYGYVQLHQPSLVYGVASKQLEGNWAKLVFQKGMLPWNHRATQKELLSYYEKLMDKWVADGKVHYYPECAYDFTQSNATSVTCGARMHSFQKIDGSASFQIQVKEKLVNGALGECKVPSICPPEFPIDDGIAVLPPNDLIEIKQTQNRKFVVMGCGKTAMDAIVYLQRALHVPVSNISWVIPNDVWMLRRSGGAGPFSWPVELLAHNMEVDSAALSMEARKQLVRLDQNILPTRFRFPVIGDDELEYLRKVTNTIRQGRIVSIEKSTKAGSEVVVHFQKENPVKFESGTTFVHCTSPGPFNGSPNKELFPKESEMILAPLFAPPIPMSMTTLAFIEAQRKSGKINTKFGRLLMEASGVPNADLCSETEILNKFIHGWEVKTGAVQTLAREQVDTLLVTAAFLCLVDVDPMVGCNFFKSNRLSFYSIPGQKVGIHETMTSIVEKHKFLQLKREEVEVAQLMADHLSPLKGM